MTLYLEATLLLLPTDTGGRAAAVEPRAGSYLPYLRAGGRTTRARLIEGPPRLAPGDAAQVVFEIEEHAAADVHPGAELALLERDARVVGSVTVLRVWGRALAV
ncbi:MAG: hypothetical protein JO197_22710 [Acidobacteria bacterium]|nr:hypothetical protein [Acidobacteriota bacterium]MBV9477981.1 hypothetical protein [Acidobacteriota bacterium]